MGLKELVSDLPERMVRWALVGALGALCGAGGVAFSLEKNWRGARVAKERELSEGLRQQQAAMAQLTTLAAEQRREMTEYRDELKQLRRDQVETMRQLVSELRRK
jgi:hypothetical protein